MFGKKLTHVMTGGKIGLTGAPIAIYGRKDKATRQKAADAAGIRVSFRKVKRSER